MTPKKSTRLPKDVEVTFTGKYHSRPSRAKKALVRIAKNAIRKTKKKVA